MKLSCAKRGLTHPCLLKYYYSCLVHEWYMSKLFSKAQIIFWDYGIACISTTKIFITIPSTGVTPKPLRAIRSERQRALAQCDQLNLHNSHSKSGRQKSWKFLDHFLCSTLRLNGWLRALSVTVSGCQKNWSYLQHESYIMHRFSD